MLDRRRPGPVKVLVLDGSPASRRLYRGACAQVFGAGCRVDEATTGEEALAFLRAGPYDLILAERELPSGLSGVDVLAAAAEESPTALRILMTATEARADAAETDPALLHAAIPKPHSEGSLADRLCSVLARF